MKIAPEIKRKAGDIEYILTRKRVKNVNLRVHTDTSVHISAPSHMGVAQVDAIVLEKAAWIQKTQERMKTHAAVLPEENTDCWTDAECLERFEKFSDAIYPIFAARLKEKPALRVRRMKSRWGVCYPRKNRITLNKRLMCRADELVEYVVLHEYVHFLHPDHQKGFHDMMFRLMPDYKQRRKALRKNSV